MIRNFFRTISNIFSKHESREAIVMFRDYLRIILRTRLPFVQKDREKILSFQVIFPYRPHFFGTLSEIFFQGIYKFTDNSIKTIIDAGANIGLSTMFFKRQYPMARILCFEPNPEVLPYLKQNITDNHLADVKIFPFALGKTDSDVELFTTANFQGSTSATIVSQASQNIGKRLKVTQRRLSDFIDSPIDFLKLDVEGSEGDVLQDLEKNNKLSHIRRMIIEYHGSEKTNGFTLGDLLCLLERNSFQYYSYPLSQDTDKCAPRFQRYMVHAKK